LIIGHENYNFLLRILKKGRGGDNILLLWTRNCSFGPKLTCVHADNASGEGVGGSGGGGGIVWEEEDSEQTDD
jgi:hypothetical protein